MAKKNGNGGAGRGGGKTAAPSPVEIFRGRGVSVSITPERDGRNYTTTINTRSGTVSIPNNISLGLDGIYRNVIPGDTRQITVNRNTPSRQSDAEFARAAQRQVTNARIATNSTSTSLFELTNVVLDSVRRRG